MSPGYDSYDLQEQWMEKKPDFAGYNCRITAFGLFGDFLDIDSDGGLYFIEKLAFQELYQVIRFESKKALETWLKKKYDTSWGQETAPPFILENDQRMK